MSEATFEQRRRLLLAELSRVVPGLYGWLATVLTPALTPGVGFLARALTALGLAMLVCAFVAAAPAPRWARRAGVYGFLACCFGAWASLGPPLRSDQLDGVRAALGALGFLLHALAWGATPKPVDSEASGHLVPGAPLLPRQKPRRWVTAAFGLFGVVALAPEAVAFSVERPGASLLAHAVGLGTGLLTLGAGTEVALRLGKPLQRSSARTRFARAAWALGVLVGALSVGLVWLALR